MARNLEVRGDRVYLNGEHVADLVPGIATSNRWMLRKLLEDVEHVEAYPFSRATWGDNRPATTGYAQVRR